MEFFDIIRREREKRERERERRMEEAKIQEMIDMSPEEKDLIHRLHRLLGDRWELIAGRLPNRKAEEVEKYWKMKEIENSEKNQIYKPICIRLSPSFKFSTAN